MFAKLKSAKCCPFRRPCVCVVCSVRTSEEEEEGIEMKAGERERKKIEKKMLRQM